MNPAREDSQRSTFKRFLPLIILAVTALMATLLILTKPQAPKTEASEKEWLVAVERIELGKHSPQISLLGTVESPYSSDLSSAVSADVMLVAVREGQMVKAGQLLIELDSRELDLKLAQAKAEVTNLSAQIAAEKNRLEFDKASLTEEEKLLAIAQQQVQRQSKLVTANMVAQERLEQSESQMAQAALSVNARQLTIQDHPNRLNQLNANLSRARTLLAQAQLDLERSKIVAPFAAIITDIPVSQGERVQVGQSLISLYDRNKIEIRAQFPNRYIPQVNLALEQGETLHGRATAYERDFQVVLERISGQVKRGAGGLDALFIPSEAQNLLALNSSVSLSIDLPEFEQTAVVPVSAIYGSNRIYRVIDGRLEGLGVEVLGKRYQPDGMDLALIRHPSLQNGDSIVTTQLPNAISGLKVKARED